MATATLDSRETDALIPPPPHTRTDLDEEDDAIQEATWRKEKETRRGDTLLLLLVLGSLITLTIYTWTLVLTNNPRQLKFFAVHPPAQTLAVTLFVSGILLLQPTRRPKSKKRGLKLHQIVQLAAGLPIILVGSLFMVYNKYDHGAPHFTSWHGKFGLIALIWLVLHILVGGASVWFNGRAVGGEDKGKALWKWHRLSGYLLIGFMLITIHLAGGYADWVKGHTTSTIRFWIYTVIPVLAFIGLFLRHRAEKMPGGHYVGSVGL